MENGNIQYLLESLVDLWDEFQGQITSNYQAEADSMSMKWVIFRMIDGKKDSQVEK